MAEKVEKKVVKVIEEKKETIKIVDVGAYTEKVPISVGIGNPRRMETLRIMFEENGADKYVTSIEWKGEMYFIFKK